MKGFTSLIVPPIPPHLSFPQESSLNHVGFKMLSLFSQTAAMAAFHTTRKQRNHSTWKAKMLSVSKDTDFSTQAGCF